MAIHYRDFCDLVGPNFSAKAVTVLGMHFPHVVIGLIQDYCRLKVKFTRVSANEVEFSPAILMPMADKSFQWFENDWHIVCDPESYKCLMCDHHCMKRHACSRSMDVALNCAGVYFLLDERLMVTGWRRNAWPIVDKSIALSKPSALIACRLRQRELANNYTLVWETVT